MRRAFQFTAIFALVLGAVACVPTAPNGTVLPTLPGTTTAPTTTRVATAPASWATAPLPDGSCDMTGSHPATFGQSAWDDFLTGLAAAAGDPNPMFAPTQGLDLRLPAGCYYMNAPITLDFHHALVDVKVDGSYTGNPALSPQFLQAYVPDCATGISLVNLQSNSSTRVAITGLTLHGSAPDVPPYCGGGPGGLHLGLSGTAAGPHHVTVSGNVVRNMWGDGIYLANVDHATLDGNDLSSSGRHLATVTGGNDLIARRNHMVGAAGVLFDIETNSGSTNVDRLLVEDNFASHSQTADTGTIRNNGILYEVFPSPNTSISDVTVRRNTSDTALVLWAYTPAAPTGSVQGMAHRIQFDANTTTSNAGQIQMYVGDNVTVTGNAILGGPPVALQSGTGSLWASATPRMYLAVPMFVPTAVCGYTSGNTYVDGGGATQPFATYSQSTIGETPGYTMPACS